MEIHPKKFMKFGCDYCKSEFSSCQSKCNHIKKFHNNSITKMSILSRNEHKVYEKDVTNNNNEMKFKCSRCEKMYKHIQSKNRHEKKCNDLNLVLMKKEITVLKKEIDTLKKKEGDTLKKKEIPTSSIIEKKASKMQQNNINGKKNNVSIVNGNVINNFNNDNLSFITPEFFKELLKEMLFEEDFPNVIPKVIEEVKFNKEHPENHNFKLNNTKSKKGDIFNNDGWKKIHEKDCIDFLTKRGYQIYKKLSETHQNQINGRYIEPNDNFNEQFLTGKIIDKTNENVKKTAIKGTDNIKLQTREELEEELSKELVI